jgi:hypothetical protein
MLSLILVYHVQVQTTFPFPATATNNDYTLSTRHQFRQGVSKILEFHSVPCVPKEDKQEYELSIT